MPQKSIKTIARKFSHFPQSTFNCSEKNRSNAMKANLPSHSVIKKMFHANLFCTFYMQFC